MFQRPSAYGQPYREWGPRAGRLGQGRAAWSAVLRGLVPHGRSAAQPRTLTRSDCCVSATAPHLPRPHRLLARHVLVTSNSCAACATPVRCVPAMCRCSLRRWSGAVRPLCLPFLTPTSASAHTRCCVVSTGRITSASTGVGTPCTWSTLGQHNG